jgi:hypothetical protein
VSTTFPATVKQRRVAQKVDICSDGKDECAARGYTSREAREIDEREMRKKHRH